MARGGSVPINAGDLRVPIAIERLETRQVEGRAADVEVWTSVHPLVWSAPESRPVAVEQYTTGGAVPQAPMQFRVRGPLSPLDTTMRVRRGARVFDIIGIQNVGEIDAELLLLCKEGQREGSSSE